MKTFQRIANVLLYHAVGNMPATREILPSINQAKQKSRQLQSSGSYKYKAE
jgi:hypothetical protein